jgi:hypothetical protein
MFKWQGASLTDTWKFFKFTGGNSKRNNVLPAQSLVH